MEDSVIEVVAKVAGIGGIAVGALMLVFRDIIRKNIFPNLSKDHAYRVLMAMIAGVWVVALAGIAAWVYVTVNDNRTQRAMSGPPYRIYFGTYYDAQNGRTYPDCRITPSVSRLVDKNIEWLAGLNPPAERIMIKAAIDRPGSREYNLALAQRCADVVANAYVSRGFITPLAIDALSFGKERASPIFDYGVTAVPQNFNTYVDIEVQQMSRSASGLTNHSSGRAEARR